MCLGRGNNCDDLMLSCVVLKTLSKHLITYDLTIGCLPYPCPNHGGDSYPVSPGAQSCNFIQRCTFQTHLIYILNASRKVVVRRMTQNFIDDMDISTLAGLLAWFLPETISFLEPGQSQLNVVKGH